MSAVVSGHPEIDLNFTDSAARKVAELIGDEKNPALKLRAFITGGGCSGFQYGFTFDEKINLDDIVINKTVNLESNKDTAEIKTADDDEAGGTSGTTTTVQLVIDAMSFQYLKGSEIEYKEDLEGAQFVIRNPNAKTTCGCGSSFAV